MPYSEKVKDRCRAMRAQGFSNAQITEATGVASSTVMRWAAEGGWRVQDLAGPPDRPDMIDTPEGLLLRDAPDVELPDDDEPLGDDADRLARIEAALERAVRKAERAVGLGNLTAAGKAAHVVDKLTRSLERLRASAPADKRDGVFYSSEDIARARVELTRRLERLGERFRMPEGL